MYRSGSDTSLRSKRFRGVFCTKKPISYFWTRAKWVLFFSRPNFRAIKQRRTPRKRLLRRLQWYILHSCHIFRLHFVTLLTPTILPFIMTFVLRTTTRTLLLRKSPSDFLSSLVYFHSYFCFWTEVDSFVILTPLNNLEKQIRGGSDLDNFSTKAPTRERCITSKVFIKVSWVLFLVPSFCSVVVLL